MSLLEQSKAFFCVSQESLREESQTHRMAEAGRDLWKDLNGIILSNHQSGGSAGAGCSGDCNQVLNT